MENKKRSHILKFRQQNRDIFLAIKNGKKKVETRAATKKYRDIKAGDILTFSCGMERFKKVVKAVKICKSVSALLKSYKPNQIIPGIETAEELKSVYDIFQGYREKIKKYGIVVWELK